MKTAGQRILGLLTALLVTVGAFAPTMVAADVEIQTTLPGIAIGTDSPTPTTVGFAGSRWVVIGYNGDGVHSEAGTMTLLLAGGYSLGTSEFNPITTQINEYNDSALQAAINDIANGIGAGEQRLIQPRTLEGGSENYNPLNPDNGYDPDKIKGAEVTGAMLWPLSVSEAQALDDTVRTHSSNWWLRSPGNLTSIAALVSGTGAVDPYGGNVNNSYGVRPAFTINLESVLFTSAADARGKDNAAVGGALQPAQLVGADLKFTVLAPDMPTPVVTLDESSENTGSLQFDFTGAATGGSQFVSAVVTPSVSDDVLYYTKLADCNANPDGTFSIDVSSLPPNDYTLKVFSEQANGDNYTDFASASQDIPFTVAADGTATVPVAAPAITTNPVDAAYTEGDPANALTVAASVTDSGELTYQWYSNNEDSTTGGTEIPGETGTSYTPPTDSAAAATTYYYAVATNTVAGKTASTPSTTAKIVVDALVHAQTPTINTQPAATTACYVGDTDVELAVEARATDGGTLTYQWYAAVDNSTNTGGTLLPGEESATYAPPTGAAGTYYYYVEITNTNNGVTGAKTASINSKVAALTVQAAPTPPPVESKPSGASTSRPAASNAQSGGASTSRPAETSGGTSSQAEKPAITLGGLPANNTVGVGDKFTLTPSEEDGQKGETGWTYDSAFFTATFNSPATFTAIKEGGSTITYTAPDGRTVNVDITIQAAGETTKPATSTTGKPTASAPGSTPKDSAIASTGDNSTVWLYVVLAAVAAVLAAGLVWYKIQKGKQ